MNADACHTRDQADDTFWENFWKCEGITSASDVWALIPSSEIRSLREEHPSSLAQLIYKSAERLELSLKEARDDTEKGKKSLRQTLNAVRLLTRLTPLVYEDSEWVGFYHSKIPSPDNDGLENRTFADKLVELVIDLMFCPGIGAHHSVSKSDSAVEAIWEAGVGILVSPPSDSTLENTRRELICLLITLASEPLYTEPQTPGKSPSNTWVPLITRSQHSLPLLASLLNTICAYDPSGVPYHHLLWTDTREPLVEACSQLLVVLLEKQSDKGIPGSFEEEGNKFLYLINRLHREEDFQFIIKGLTRLIYNPLQSSYLPSSQRRLSCHQELLLLIWRICDLNKTFLHHILKTGDMLDLLVPILHHLNEARNDPSRLGLIHISVFLLLLFSGERNFGVRLNATWTSRAALDVPSFNGTHADLLIIIFHKLITTGHPRICSLYDCLLTVIVNISPYLKNLSMATATKLLQLMEIFSQPSFLFSHQQNHHLVFFLLESFNNLVQYQFDGNSPLVYSIIRRRKVFYQLAALPTDLNSIDRLRSKRAKNDTKKRHEKLKQIASEHRQNAELGNIDDAASLDEAQRNVTFETDIADNISNSDLSVNESEQPAEGKIEALEQAENSGHAKDGQNIQIEHHSSIPQVMKMTEEILDGTKQTDVNCDVSEAPQWEATSNWASSWKNRLPLQTIMRLLQVLVPQVEKICLEKQISDENDILKFIKSGTLVGLLPVPHPILIRRYQTNLGTNRWLQTYTWGVIYLRNSDPPIWFDTDVKLFEIQRF
ncbi:unnamed protein product [Oikopleura dioica]|uniref:Uncharacterized protein n=1 Tax=Oikopleura dioica TaxID=34765 RepID=E4X9M2_OIKDI|nr:unnamed protein product [Oikopleura dioica]